MIGIGHAAPDLRDSSRRDTRARMIPGIDPHAGRRRQVPEPNDPVDATVLGDLRLHHGCRTLANDVKVRMLRRDRFVDHDRDGRGPTEGGQPGDVPDGNRLLGDIDVVRLQLLQKAQGPRRTREPHSHPPGERCCRRIVF
jgi:hypothetical protein